LMNSSVIESCLTSLATIACTQSIPSLLATLILSRCSYIQERPLRLLGTSMASCHRQICRRLRLTIFVSWLQIMDSNMTSGTCVNLLRLRQPKLHSPMRILIYWS
jgi:hypothetical protein